MVDIRPLDAMDRVFLEDMLLEAFFWDPAWPRPTLAEFREHPEFTKLLADWGRPGDRGVVTKEQQSKTGAAWFRLWRSELHSYGFVDAETPERASRWLRLTVPRESDALFFGRSSRSPAQTAIRPSA
jgi:hypothetical protein